MLGQLPNRSWRAFGPPTDADENPGGLALLTVSTLVLLAGLLGGLRALQGRLREGLAPPES